MNSEHHEQCTVCVVLQGVDSGYQGGSNAAARNKEDAKMGTVSKGISKRYVESRKPNQSRDCCLPAGTWQILGAASHNNVCVTKLLVSGDLSSFLRLLDCRNSFVLFVF